MEKKIQYASPELDIITFACGDVVTASFGSDNGFDGEVDSDW